MSAEIGDYIIQGVKGEIYPCKSDIFEKTYSEVIEENFITDLAQELVTQDRDGTRLPFWVVHEDRKNYVHFMDDWTDSERDVDVEDTDLWCDSCYGKYERGKNLPYSCEDCDTEAFLYYTISREPNFYGGIFLTKEACQNHIRNKSHHYENPCTYAYSFHANWQMQQVLKYLIASGGQNPKDYNLD